MSGVRVFVIGSEGQVARSLRERALAAPDVVLGYCGRPDVDLTRPETILPSMEALRAAAGGQRRRLHRRRPGGERSPTWRSRINRDGAAAAGRRRRASRALPVIHLSTDYVFDGAKPSPYVESDPTAPQSVYGRSKLAGEQAVADAAPRHIILRTSWIFAPFGGNFVRTMLRLAAAQDRLRVVDDQIGCPTYAPDIAAAILSIGREVAGDGWQDDHAGVTHLAGPDEMSWCAFARTIVAAGAEHGGRRVTVDAITTADYPTPAKRPANSRLATGRLETVFGVRMPPLQKSLANCLARLRETAGEHA